MRTSTATLAPIAPVLGGCATTTCQPGWTGTGAQPFGSSESA